MKPAMTKLIAIFALSLLLSASFCFAQEDKAENTDDLGDEIGKKEYHKRLGALTAQLRSHIRPFIGIGLMLELETNVGWRVHSVFPDTPASRTKLRQADTVTHIDGRELSRLNESTVIDLLRGPDGSDVSLTVLPRGQKGPHVLSIKRERIDVSKRLGGLINPSRPRITRTWSPTELEEKSDVVVIGIVTDVKETGERSRVKRGFHSALPAKIRQATVEVIETMKGGQRQELVFEYRALDWGKMTLQIRRNWPMLISVEKGKPYLMYLRKKKDEDIFVGALDGFFDDGWAVSAAEPSPLSVQTDSSGVVTGFSIGERRVMVAEAVKHLRRAKAFSRIRQWQIRSGTNVCVFSFNGDPTSDFGQAVVEALLDITNLEGGTNGE